MKFTAQEALANAIMREDWAKKAEKKGLVEVARELHLTAWLFRFYAARMALEEGK